MIFNFESNDMMVIELLVSDIVNVDYKMSGSIFQPRVLFIQRTLFRIVVIGPNVSFHYYVYTDLNAKNV